MGSLQCAPAHSVLEPLPGSPDLWPRARLARRARRVAVHHELVVVELRVVVRLAVAQHGVNHPQQLVRHGEDRLLVAVVALELRAIGARRAVGALG